MRIEHFPDLQSLLEVPPRIVRWRDELSGVEIFARGCILGEWLSWKDSRWSCERDAQDEHRIKGWRPQIFMAHVLAQVCSFDPAGQEPLWPAVTAALIELEQPKRPRYLPLGIQHQLFGCSQRASGIPSAPERISESIQKNGSPFERLRQAYVGSDWFGGMMPMVIMESGEEDPDPWAEAVFHVRGRTAAEYFSSIQTRRKCDGAIDAELGLPALVCSVLLSAEGTPLIPEDQQDCVLAMPYGAAKAIEEASGQAAGFTAGVVDFFRPKRPAGVMIPGDEN